MNNEMLGFSSKIFDYKTRTNKSRRLDEFEDIMDEFDDQDHNLSPSGYKRKTEQDRIEDIKTTQMFLVYFPNN
jgi:hypothetical protein